MALDVEVQAEFDRLWSAIEDIQEGVQEAINEIDETIDEIFTQIQEVREDANDLNGD